MSENEKKPVNRKVFEDQIIKRAQSDKNFRKSLMDNPKETLRQLGFQVHEKVEVKVVEESAKVVYLVLPVHPDELADEQLDDVAGGCIHGCIGYDDPGGCWADACLPVYGVCPDFLT